MKQCGGCTWQKEAPHFNPRPLISTHPHRTELWSMLPAPLISNEGLRKRNSYKVSVLLYLINNFNAFWNLWTEGDTPLAVDLQEQASLSQSVQHAPSPSRQHLFSELRSFIGTMLSLLPLPCSAFSSVIYSLVMTYIIIIPLILLIPSILFSKFHMAII